MISYYIKMCQYTKIRSDHVEIKRDGYLEQLKMVDFHRWHNFLLNAN